MKYFIVLFLLMSCSTSPKKVLLDYQPFSEEEEKRKYKISLFDIKEESMSFRRDNFQHEMIYDEELENDLYEEYKTENEKNFFSNLGKKIKIDVIFSLPLKRYEITSTYGTRVHPIRKKSHFHKGVDLKSKNQNIYAIKEGRVIISKFSKTYGNIIAIRHANGLTSLYAHNKINYVKKGDYIKRNQVIGVIGSTGYVTGKHLHFELRKYNQNIDPLKFFRKKIIK